MAVGNTVGGFARTPEPEKTEMCCHCEQLVPVSELTEIENFDSIGTAVGSTKICALCLEEISEDRKNRSQYWGLRTERVVDEDWEAEL